MRILLTGGRAPATLELARLFHRQGHTVLVAESLKTHLSAPSRAATRNVLIPAPNPNPEPFIAALAALIQHESIDLLIPTCEEIFWIAQNHECLSQLCTVFCEPLNRLLRLHNKWEFIQRASTYGLSVPKTTLLTSPNDLASLQPPLVLKPVYSRFAAQTKFFRQKGNLPSIHPTPQRPWVAQQFIEGQQLCTYSIAHQGRLVAHTCYPTYFTAGQGATIHFHHIDHPAALAWATAFIQREAFTGQIAFDFIQTLSGQLFALECNPRATSGIHLLASNPNFSQAFLTSDSDLLTPFPNADSMLSAAMLIYGLPAAFSTQALSRWATAFTTARDVLFTWNDPLPALWQFFSLLTFVWRGLRQGISPLEASTLDIEWNGES